MNRISGAFALIALAAASVDAQTRPGESMPPPSSTPSSQYPSSTTPPASTAQPDTPSRSTKESKKAQMKDCMAQQQANNSGMSRQEIKKYCKEQLSTTAPHS